MSNWTTILFWTAAVGIVFGYLWWQGQLRRLAAYVQETREELNSVSQAGCNKVQGFYFSRPVPASELEAVLTQCPQKFALAA